MLYECRLQILLDLVVDRQLFVLTLLAFAVDHMSTRAAQQISDHYSVLTVNKRIQRQRLFLFPLCRGYIFAAARTAVAGMQPFALYRASVLDLRLPVELVKNVEKRVAFHTQRNRCTEIEFEAIA